MCLFILFSLARKVRTFDYKPKIKKKCEIIQMTLCYNLFININREEKNGQPLWDSFVEKNLFFGSCILSLGFYKKIKTHLHSTNEFVSKQAKLKLNYKCNFFSCVYCCHILYAINLYDNISLRTGSTN